MTTLYNMLRIYSGKRPATCEDTPTGSLLLERAYLGRVDLPDDVLAQQSYFRIEDADTGECYAQGASYEMLELGIGI